ncbi:general secretion pathway protein GspB [Psychromonas sp. KJ10-10]|uniref:general secretion pathway protein GspB n=1 Tax=Psychromonas sp. KJ10-10 TaxID=3391823 RepID=UPI0039B50DE1
MSTISKALLKNKFEQMGGMPPVNQVQNKNIFWKVIFSIATLIIIILLSILIYLQFYPYQKVEATTTIVPEVVKAPATKPEIDTTLVKMTFDTQPIPVVKQEIKATQVPSKTKAIQTQAPQTALPETPIVTSQPAPETNTFNDKPAVIAKEPTLAEEPEPTLNYDEISEDLKKRFELAVLLTEIEQDESDVEGTSEDSFVEENSDGSDIHLMSSNFQNKIPLMRYDSHVYSSLATERWIQINGERLVEGSFDSTGKLEVIEIQPQRSIFRFGRQSFSLESLTDWKGY